jgi:pSer/pThr/pTyr-binding forkhead associated (FHA) protein
MTDGDFTEDVAVRPAVQRSAASCPSCGHLAPIEVRFCEQCGHDSGPVAEPAWTVVIACDRDHYDAVAPSDVQFPETPRPRTFALDGAVVTIGRTSLSRSIHPDIDLGELPADPGVSHCHAELRRAADGRYTVVDVGSTNGTTVNGEDNALAAGVPVTLADGDRIHLGAFTTLTVRAPKGRGARR